MSVPAYDAVSKPASGLLEGPYPKFYKIDLKAAGSNGFSFGAETIIGEIAPSSEKNKRAAARVVTKVENIKVGPSFKIDRVAVDSHKIVYADFSLTDAFKGAKFTFNAQDATRAVPLEEDNKPVLATIGAEYKHEFATAALTVEAINKDASASVVGHYEGFLAGVKAQANQGKDGFALKDYGVLAGYKSKEVSASVAAEKKFGWFTASYFQSVNPRLAVAASAKLPRNKEVAAAAKKDETSVSAGVQYKPEGSADVTWAAKVTTDGGKKNTLALSYAQQLTVNAKATAAASIDLLDIASDKHTFNVGFSLTA